MVAMIQGHTCTVDFWFHAYKQNRLRGDLVEFLDDHGLVPFEKQEAEADEIAELAKALHTRLCPS
jgi:type I restriction enzyme R subunit